MATSTSTGKSDKIRCAVIGLGMGGGHANGYIACPESELVAVADLDASRLTKWAEQIGDDHCYTDYKAMLKAEKPDIVSIALPNFLHKQVTLDAIAAGANVLCEKPMAMNLAEATEMRDAAKAAGVKLGINLSYRSTPQGQALKELSDTGMLGIPYHAHTKWTRRDGFPKFGGWFGQKKASGGGPLIDLGVHRIDLAMWLMGHPSPISVSGMLHHHIGVPRAKKEGKDFDVEDLAAGFIRFDNGASMTLEISWASHQQEKELIQTSVLGDKASFVHRNVNGGYEFIAEYHTDINGHKISGVVDPRPNCPSSYTSMVHAVLNDTKPMADAEDGLRIQRVLDGLYESAVTGREVRFD